MYNFNADECLTIGVLDLQGCVSLHQPHIEALDAEFVTVKSPEDFKSVHALILPGGESSTMIKNLDNLKLWDELRDCTKRVPVWGICAGAILMAQKTVPKQNSLNLMDVQVERNAYGRQTESKQAEVKGYPVSFIRAPIVTVFNPTTTTVIHSDGDNPVWLENNQHMLSTFHSELCNLYPSPLHAAFLAKIHSFYKNKAN